MDDRRYWQKRHQTIGDLRVVGCANKSAAENAAEYTRAGARFLELVTIDLPHAARRTVLDIGYGLGHYARLCKTAGFEEYVGVDFAAPPGPDLGPRYTYQQADAGALLTLGRRFDLVIAIDVLFHLTDDRRFNTALDNIRTHTRPGGIVYATGRFQEARTASHVVHRGLERFTGLGELIAVESWRDTSIARIRTQAHGPQ